MFLRLFALLYLSGFALAVAKVRLSDPDWNVYLRGTAYMEAVKQLVAQYPDVIKYELRSESSDGYKADVPILTLDTGRANPNKLRTLFSFGEHAREIITTEVVLPLLKDLAERYQALVGAADIESREQAAKEAFSKGQDTTLDVLLPLTTIKIIPMENMNSRPLVEAGQYCERKNGRGVDVNRNFPVDWGKKESDYDPKEEYPGTGPLSEPEAKILHALTKEYRQHAWVSTHSGMEALFLPYDHKNEIPTGPGPDAQLAILKQLNSEMCNNRCAVGPGGKTVGYLAHGTVTDWMFVEGKVPFSSTWEIYGDFNAPFEDCYRMFNPLTKEGHDDVVRRWHKGFIRLVELLPTHPVVRSMVTDSPMPTPTAAVSEASTEATSSTTRTGTGNSYAASANGQKMSAASIVQEIFGTTRIQGGSSTLERPTFPAPAAPTHTKKDDQLFFFYRMPSFLEMAFVGFITFAIVVAYRSTSRRGVARSRLNV